MTGHSLTYEQHKCCYGDKLTGLCVILTVMQLSNKTSKERNNISVMDLEPEGFPLTQASIWVTNSTVAQVIHTFIHSFIHLCSSFRHSLHPFAHSHALISTHPSLSGKAFILKFISHVWALTFLHLVAVLWVFLK